MKELYELLNEVQIDLNEYDDSTLSEFENKRIKKRLFNNLSRKSQGRKIIKTQFSKVCACAAIVLCLSSISVAAATGVLTEGIKTLFHIDSMEKEKVASDMTSTAGMVSENKGYKITAESVMRDKKHICIVYAVEKSDGSSLDKTGKNCLNVDFWDFNCEDNKGNSWCAGDVGKLDQKVETNTIRYATTFICDAKMDKKINVTLNDLRLWFEGDESEVDIEGDWKFSIPTDYDDCSVNLAKNQKLEFVGAQANLEELTISPMGYYLSVGIKDKLDSDKIIRKMESSDYIYLQLKNGDKISLEGASSSVVNDDGTWSFRVYGTFDRLILLEEMDKAVIGEEEFEIK